MLLPRYNPVPMDKLTDEEDMMFLEIENITCAAVLLTTPNIKVRYDHCHFTGTYRGAARNKFNPP